VRAGDAGVRRQQGSGEAVVRIDVDHGGTATQWAGQPGMAGYADGTLANARFAQPHDITSDGGKLYVSDGNNDVIRVIDIASGMVSTLAGGPGMCGFVDMPGAQARFCAPQGIVADGAGNLYVADNNAVRKIVISGAAVSQLVANNGLGFVDGPSGTAKLWGPFRMTFDAGKQFLYFSDQGNDAVRRVEVATGIVSTVAGGPSKTMIVEGPPGSINQPGGLAFAPTGELLVAVPRESSIVQIRLP
jgi:DNA-binding beta-propeller fold protein YncE